MKSGEVRLWKLTRKQVREKLASGKLKSAFLPTGSTEQHNEHLAMEHDTASALLMALLWLVQLKTSDPGIVDSVWALAVGAVSIFFATNGEGDPDRRLLISILAGAWGLRLGAYLLYRNFTLPEAGRYSRLREKYATTHNYPLSASTHPF